MTAIEIEKQLLKLDVRSRAKVVQMLLRSLDELSEAENDLLWAQEALRRHEEILKSNTKQRSTDKVIQKARARLK